MNKDKGSLIVCHCKSMKLSSIEKLLERKKLTSAKEVMRYLQVGTGCGCCLFAVRSIVADARMNIKEQS
mgnify:CR=1 FL=1